MFLHSEQMRHRNQTQTKRKEIWRRQKQILPAILTSFQKLSLPTDHLRKFRNSKKQPDAGKRGGTGLSQRNHHILLAEYTPPKHYLTIEQHSGQKQAVFDSD